MKFQLKALAAAAILAAALPAQAAIDTSASGNGSLILTVFDRVANISAAFDLGKNYLDFNQVASAGAVSTATASGTSFSWDLASNADYAPAWSQFLASATLPNIQYAISGADNLGAGAGARGLITTYSAVGGNLTTGQVTTIGNAFDAYTFENIGPAALFQNHTTVANGSSVANAGTSFGGTYYLAGKNYNVGATSVGALGADLGVLQYVSGASSFATAPVTLFGNGAKFNLASNGALLYSTNSVAPIPEADTWAMMLLGLGFMGFVARRKQA